MLLARLDRSLSNVIHVLSEYQENIGDSPDEAEKEDGEDEKVEEELSEVEEQKAILGHLITYLKSLD